MIDIPAYKGEWKVASIPSPEFKEDPYLGYYRIGRIGSDSRQAKSGSIFDDIVVTLDASVAIKEKQDKEAEAAAATAE
ncbi:hypothetical protein FBU30_002627 [Linnemannia zychae]|nr:hypothetical protein FBU30_002627 [Linnemannia zychae]